MTETVVVGGWGWEREDCGCDEEEETEGAAEEVTVLGTALDTGGCTCEEECIMNTSVQHKLLLHVKL